MKKFISLLIASVLMFAASASAADKDFFITLAHNLAEDHAVHIAMTQWADVAQKYAQSQGYSIDGTALLALHARIDKINTPDMRLGFFQVRNIVDEAIEKTEKRGSGKLFSAFAKKNENDLIPLTEDSFM